MSRRGRRGRGRWLIGSVMVVVVGGGAGAWVLASRDTTAASPAAPATTAARRATLTQTVDASFTLAKQDTVKLASPAGGTVTSVGLTTGRTITALTKLATIDGNPVYGIPSSYPLYRSLASGDEGNDVKALEAALDAAGYDPGDVDGTFDSDTVTALEDWQADQDLDETGKLDLSTFVSYQPGYVVDAVAVAVGDRVRQGGDLATLAPVHSLVATADVSQLDVNKLKVGQRVELTFDGLSSATASGKVSEIAASAESASNSAGSSTVVQFAVTVTVDKLPSGAKTGMTGQASVITASRNNVVVVPSSAINGSSSNPTVQVVSATGAITSRPVLVGLVTTQGSEILTGLKAGERVVTGVTATANAVTTTTRSQGNGLFGGGGGGGGFGGGGGGAGGGQ